MNSLDHNQLCVMLDVIKSFVFNNLTNMFDYINVSLMNLN